MADVKLPQLGESVTEGTLGKWLKRVGDTVGKYEALVEITTDKVNAEVPSDFEGVLEEILVQEGETVRVGTVICRIHEHAEAAGSATAIAKDSGTTGSPVFSDSHPEPPARQGQPSGRGSVGGRFSPAVLRLAEEHNVDLTQVSGTGEGGRITRKDVLTFVDTIRHTSADVGRPAPEGIENRAPEGQGKEIRRQETSPIAVNGTRDEGASSRPHARPDGFLDDVTVLQPSPVRKTIARRMLESKRNAPHAWTMVEADVTQLAAYRTAQKPDFKRKEGIDLTFMPFFIKAVVEGLKQYPMLNASWVDDEILVKRRIHISLAVATDEALVVPVIHDADRLSIAGLAHAVNDLAAKARSGRLTIADVEGGTFTVNNTGAFGSVLSQPIINSGQAAILSFESIVKRPVVVNDAIAIRSMINLSLSLDHRLLDGWVAGQFLKAVRQRLESYNSDTILY